MGSKNQKLNLDRDTLYDLYITQKMTSKEVGEIFDCSSKTIRNYLKLYNIPIRQNGESVKLDRSKWSKEKEQARSLKFMNTWKNTPEDIKKEIIVRRTANSNPPEAIQKARETRIKNNSFIKSKSENAFYDKLCAIFGNNNVLHGYQDNRYYLDCPTYRFLFETNQLNDLKQLKQRIDNQNYSFETRLLYGLPLTYEEYNDDILTKTKLQRVRK